MHARGRAPFRFAGLPLEIHFAAVLILDILSAGLQVDHDPVQLMIVQGSLGVWMIGDDYDSDLVVVDRRPALSEEGGPGDEEDRGPAAEVRHSKTHWLMIQPDACRGI